MKQLSNWFLVLIALSGCTPVLSDMQSARHLKKNQFEITPSITAANWFIVPVPVQFHGGLQAGYGITDRLEARARYEFISGEYPSGYIYHSTPAYIKPNEEMPRIIAHAFSFGAKYSIVKDKLSLYLPVGVAKGKDISTPDTWQIIPTLLYTYRFSNRLEITPTIKIIDTFSSGDDFIGGNFGIGLSSNLDKWVVRPEFGAFLGLNSSLFFQGSIGFSYRR